MYWIMLLNSIIMQPEFKPVEQQIHRQGMTVKWHFDQERIFFEMQAPTNGWLAIGFNESEHITGTYLIMGRVVQGVAEIVEHKTLHPGDYRPVTQLGDPASVTVLHGDELAGSSIIRFSLPREAAGKQQKPLNPGDSYVLIMAFSREDDFQHHSTMRTSLLVIL
jgi:hypothetical protein